jgi:hypothetical protein
MTACSLCGTETVDGALCPRCGRDVSSGVPSWETEARTLARVRRLEAVNVVKMNQPRVSLVEAVAIVDRWLHEDGAGSR